MNLQQKISEDLKLSMSEGNTKKRDLLRVVMGEMSRVGKQLSDSEIIKILKKMVDSAKECGNIEEVPILQEYLPNELTQEEVTPIVKGIIFDNQLTIKDMGKIIAECKVRFGDRFDGGLVSKVIKLVLS